MTLVLSRAHTAQQAASAPRGHERPTLLVFHIARLLADHHELRVARAFPKHRLLRVLPEPAAAAAIRGTTQHSQRVALGQEGRGPGCGSRFHTAITYTPSDSVQRRVSTARTLLDYALMPRFGYKLMSEEHGPLQLVANARHAEELGFDFVGISDHYHPWVMQQGHAPAAWPVLGAIAARTLQIGLATAVTCPSLRYRPAIIAQFAATLSILSGGRFTLALGAGENLNEHVVGAAWPPVNLHRGVDHDACSFVQLNIRFGSNRDIRTFSKQITHHRFPRRALIPPCGRLPSVPPLRRMFARVRS